MKRIGFLGCGKIGQALLKHIKELDGVDVAFVQDPVYTKAAGDTFPVVTKGDKDLYATADLIIECANASVLKEWGVTMLQATDVLTFSVTAFSDPSFWDTMVQCKQTSGHHLYIPHGAILGLDGIFDGRAMWTAIKIVTTKSPKRLGRTDTERTVLYDGPTRKACELFPRNVNVHASVALAGIGFDRTESVIIVDPAVETNAHHIYLDSDSTHMELIISSVAKGAVSGAYTPQSACGSLDRVLQHTRDVLFV